MWMGASRRRLAPNPLKPLLFGNFLKSRMKLNPTTIFFACLAVLIVATISYLSGGSPSVEKKSSIMPALATATDQPGSKQEIGEFQPATKREPQRRTQGAEAAPKAPTRPIDPSEDPNDTRPMAVKYSEFYKRPDWEQDIIKLAGRLDMPDDRKALALLNKVHTLPDEPAKVVAVEHATHLMSDEQFKQLRSQIMSLNDTGGEDMKDAILRDILTRAENVRMPALVDLLRRPTYPGQQEVREILEAYLEVDYGTDFPKWDAAVRQWLIENDELE